MRGLGAEKKCLRLPSVQYFHQSMLVHWYERLSLSQDKLPYRGAFTN